MREVSRNESCATSTVLTVEAVRTGVDGARIAAGAHPHHALVLQHRKCGAAGFAGELRTCRHEGCKIKVAVKTLLRVLGRCAMPCKASPFSSYAQHRCFWRASPVVQSHTARLERTSTSLLHFDIAQSKGHDKGRTCTLEKRRLHTLPAATAHLAAAVGSPCMHRCPHPISSRGTRTESDRQASAGPAQYTQSTVSHWCTGTVGLDAGRQDADLRSAEISIELHCVQLCQPETCSLTAMLHCHRQDRLSGALRCST